MRFLWAAFGRMFAEVSGFADRGGKFVQSVGLSGRLCHFLLLFS